MIGNLHTAQRIVNAEKAFLDIVESKGFTRDQAAQILSTYKRHRLIKIDPVGSSFHVKHGAFLDADILRNALNT